MSYTSEYTGGQKNNATIEKGMAIDKREAISNGYIKFLQSNVSLSHKWRWIKAQFYQC